MSGFKIDALDTGEGDGFTGVPPPLPSRSFALLSVGPPGVGKTNFLLNLLKNAYTGQFDRIYLWSPSLDMLKSGGSAGDIARAIPQDQIYESFRISDLSDILKAIKNTSQKVLLIFDDSVNDINSDKVEFRKALGRLLYNRRNLAGKGGHASVIVTTQVFNQVPLRLRKVMSHLMMHSLSPREQDEVWKTMLDCPKPAYREIIDTIWPPHDPSARYNAMFTDLVNRRFYRLKDRVLEATPVYDAFSQEFQLRDKTNSDSGAATRTAANRPSTVYTTRPEYQEEVLRALKGSYSYDADSDESDEEDEMDEGPGMNVPRRIDAMPAAQMPERAPSRTALPLVGPRPSGSSVFWPGGRLW